MSQTPYTFEYEIKASPKVLYPYLSSPSGLQQWFADKVIVRGSSELHFYWDNENHPALVLPGKANKSVKFDFKKGDSEPGKHIIELRIVGLFNRQTERNRRELRCARLIN
jgi:uncharacterized protein YndB with AHSA1/START domain